MSVTNPVERAVGNGGPGSEEEAAAQQGSLRERLAEKRKQLQEQRTITLPVPGYAEEGLHVRYHGLVYNELRRIVKRHERHLDTPEGEVAQAADILIQACDGLFEKNGEGEYEKVAERWSPEAAKDLFGITDELTTSRLAMYAIFPNDGGVSLLLHYRKYDQWLGGVEPEVDTEMEKEYGAS